jgi:hypothetical protein
MDISLAIQNRKQFEHSYNTDEMYRMIKSKIPPGVDEIGVLLFEPLDSVWDDVRFIIQLYAGSQDNRFVFDVKLST